MQYYLVALENIRKFAEAYDPAFKLRIDTISGLLEQLWLKGPAAAESKDEIALIKHKCEKALSYLIDNTDKISEILTENEYKWLIQNANVLLQSVELAERSGYGFSYRDESMAKNISWILDNNPDAKIVLWAHNGHILKYSGIMGGFLSKKYGNNYYNIGFLSNSGTYTAKNSTTLSSNNILVKSKPGSFEYSFHRTNVPIFYFDFGQVNDYETESKWLTDRLNYRSIGALATDNQFMQIRISKLFNSIIYIDSTHASNCFDVIK